MSQLSAYIKLRALQQHRQLYKLAELRLPMYGTPVALALHAVELSHIFKKLSGSMQANDLGGAFCMQKPESHQS